MELGGSSDDVDYAGFLIFQFSLPLRASQVDLRQNIFDCGKLLDLAWAVCPYCETPQAEQSHPSRRSASFYARADSTYPSATMVDDESR